jgi:hypothetical protein
MKKPGGLSQEHSDKFIIWRNNVEDVGQAQLALDLLRRV